MAKARTTYRELRAVAIPEAVPEFGIEAGAMWTIATVYGDGRMLDVEVSDESGATIGFADLRVEEDGSLSLACFTPLTSR